MESERSEAMGTSQLPTCSPLRYENSPLAGEALCGSPSGTRGREKLSDTRRNTTPDPLFDAGLVAVILNPRVHDGQSNEGQRERERERVPEDALGQVTRVPEDSLAHRRP